MLLEEGGSVPGSLGSCSIPFPMGGGECTQATLERATIVLEVVSLLIVHQGRAVSLFCSLLWPWHLAQG